MFCQNLFPIPDIQNHCDWLFFVSDCPEGFKEAADKFGSETGICYPYDMESLDERIKIREALEVGDIEKAINNINTLHPELIDTNRDLAFHLRVRLHSYYFHITANGLHFWTHKNVWRQNSQFDDKTFA